MSSTCSSHHRLQDTRYTPSANQHLCIQRPKDFNVAHYKKRAEDKTRYLKLEYLLEVTSLLQLTPDGRKLKPWGGNGDAEVSLVRALRALIALNCPNQPLLGPHPPLPTAQELYLRAALCFYPLSRLCCRCACLWPCLLGGPWTCTVSTFSPAPDQSPWVGPPPGSSLCLVWDCCGMVL